MLRVCVAVQKRDAAATCRLTTRARLPQAHLALPPLLHSRAAADAVADGQVGDVSTQQRRDSCCCCAALLKCRAAVCTRRPVIAFVVAFLLLGVENIGAQIEEVRAHGPAAVVVVVVRMAQSPSAMLTCRHCRRVPATACSQPFHVIAFNAFCAAVQRNVFEAASMHASSSSNGGQLGANAPVVTGLARSSAAGGCGCAQQAKGTDTAAASPVWHHAAGDAAACTRRSISATDRAAAAAAAAGVGAPVVASLHVVGPDSQRVHASSSQSWLMAPGHDLAPRPRPPQHTE